MPSRGAARILVSAYGHQRLEERQMTINSAIHPFETTDSLTHRYTNMRAWVRGQWRFFKDSARLGA
jgi:hypothetical protein